MAVRTPWLLGFPVGDVCEGRGIHLGGEFTFLFIKSAKWMSSVSLPACLLETMARGYSTAVSGDMIFIVEFLLAWKGTVHDLTMAHCEYV